MFNIMSTHLLPQKSVQKRLKSILNSNRLQKWLLAIFALFLVQALGAQNLIRVQGRVLSDKNEALPLATVVLVGTGTGVQTDENGSYSIETPPDGVLQASYIGYESVDIPVSGRTQIDFALGTMVLQEVVVIGYGTARKRDVTGSIVSVNSSELKEVPAGNTIQALQGRLAGVDIARNGTRPGSGGQIRIRGSRSLFASNDPFLVVDGIPYGGSINDLNPDDIANIEVLKDASATAIYGSRGSNGVILISTKKGSAGKPVLTYDGYYGVSQIIDQYKVFGAQEFEDLRDIAGYNTLSPDEVQGLANGVNTNWQDYLYNNGSISNHSLGISGGTDMMTYSIGGGYFKEDGVITGQSFDRYSIRASLDAKISKNIKVGLNSMNTLGTTKGEGLNPIYNTMRINPALSPYNADGSINLRPLVGTVDEFSTANPLTLDDSDAVVQSRRRLRTFNSLYGEVNIWKGLKYRLNVGLDYRQENYGEYIGPNTIINPGGVEPTQNRARASFGEGWDYVIENLLTYDQTFNEKHRVGVTLLYSVQKSQSVGSGTFQTTQLPGDFVQYYALNLGSGGLTFLDGTGGSFSRRGLVSYMGRLNYTFNGKYLLTATFRRDGSSIFPSGTWLNYPAFSLGWNIADEDFLSGSTVLNTLKLRAGYGVTGQQDIPTSAYLGGLSTNTRYNYGTTLVNGVLVTSLPNRDIRWESTETTNFGIDFGLFENRLTGSVDVYTQKTDGLLIQKQLPLSNGANNYWTNAAKTEGNGVEVVLSADLLRSSQTDGFQFSVDLNFSVARDKVVELQDPTLQQDIQNGLFVGHPISAIFDYTKLGIWQKDEADLAASYNSAFYVSKPGEIKIADINNDGVINADDRSIIGSAQPDWTGGVTLRFGYKNFDLSMVTFARMGGTLIATYFQNDGTTSGYFGFGTGRSNQFAVDYWTPVNATNAFPIPNNNDRKQFSSTLGYYDASFIRVRSINLGYTFPKSWTSNIGVESLRVYLSSQNPFILYSPFVSAGLGIDPEGTGTGGAINPQGASNGAIRSGTITAGLSTPPVKSLILGLNIKF